ncbi:replication initiation protein, partial [Staphylococcus aureus]|nr:replication initiation protein [Staphylococcus aureus]
MSKKEQRIFSNQSIGRENSNFVKTGYSNSCLLYTSPSPRDRSLSR